MAHRARDESCQYDSCFHVVIPLVLLMIELQDVICGFPARNRKISALPFQEEVGSAFDFPNLIMAGGLVPVMNQRSFCPGHQGCGVLPFSRKVSPFRNSSPFTAGLPGLKSAMASTKST